MLKKLRLAAALITFAAFVALFADMSGVMRSWLAPLAKWQLIPALLAVNIAAIVVIALLTLAIGRLYCSVLCPLGVYQDVVSRVAALASGKKKRRAGRFGYALPRRRWRLAFLGIFIALAAVALLGLVPMSFASVIEPYSIFGRMATWLGRPLAVAINNVAAQASAALGGYWFSPVSQLPLSLTLIIVATASWAVVTVMAWRGGRDYCNTVCPVGTALGFISRYSFLKPVINADKCTRCGACARKCKAKCINPKTHEIDMSRCVACFDCIGACREGAISYGRKPAACRMPHAADGGRRSFMLTSALVAGGLAANAAKRSSDGGLAPLQPKKSIKRQIRICPPGAGSARAFESKCVACQLCIDRCPNGVLTPSTSLERFMQPKMTFERGYCRPECTLCTDVCPTGALKSMSIPAKSSTKIGTATVRLDACMSAAYGEQCGHCARQCPSGAIAMVPVAEGDNRLRPLVDTSRCIGCGSCEYHCPVGRAARFRSGEPAIFVEGIETQYII